MGLCWPLLMPPTPKAVLISLADQANNHGSCWPSIAGICERTCFGRTAVIEAIKWLEDCDYLSIDKNGGRTNRYCLNISRLRQREIEPVRQADQSGRRTSPADGPTSPRGELPPVREADQPARQADPNRKEPSEEPNTKDKRVPALTIPQLVADGLSEQTAAEWLAHRKRKRAALTPRAWDGVKAEAAKVGWEIEAAVCKALERGWVSFDASYVTPKQKAFRPSSETAYQRSQRELIEQVSPRLARKVASQPMTIDLHAGADGVLELPQ